MSVHFEDERIDRRPIRFSSVRDVSSAQSEIAAYMLGIVATFAFIIELTYAAIGLWRMFS